MRVRVCPRTKRIGCCEEVFFVYDYERVLFTAPIRKKLRLNYYYYLTLLLQLLQFHLYERIRRVAFEQIFHVYVCQFHSLKVRCSLLLLHQFLLRLEFFSRDLSKRPFRRWFHVRFSQLLIKFSLLLRNLHLGVHLHKLLVD